MTFCFNQIPFYLNESKFGEANNAGLAGSFGESGKWMANGHHTMLFDKKRDLSS